MVYRNDTAFYARLETLERTLAAQAADPDVAAIHTQLAEGYGRMIDRPSAPKMRVMV